MGAFSTGKDRSREGRVLTPWQGSLLLNPAPLPVASVSRSDRSAVRRGSSSSNSSWVSLQLDTSQSEWHQQEIKNNQYSVVEVMMMKLPFCLVLFFFVSQENERGWTEDSLGVSTVAITAYFDYVCNLCTYTSDV